MPRLVGGVEMLKSWSNTHMWQLRIRRDISVVEVSPE